MKKLLLILKKFFSKKKNIIIAIICFIILLSVILILLFGNFNNGRFVLDRIYEVYPRDVRKLYSNVVDVSCYGDLHFDIELDRGEKKIEEISKNDLLNYMFSYLDKSELLTDNIDSSIIKKTEKELFLNNVDLLNNIKDYSYGDYIYNDKDGIIIRKKEACNSNIKYVSHLFGYSYNNKELSIDINVAYLVDGVLYNFNDEKLGEYDGDKSKLFELTQKTSYYRLKYVKRNGIYKLSNIEWKSRT